MVDVVNAEGPDGRIAQLEAELASLRREMQDFSYVVSHDLRAPLRHIVSFARLVKEDAGPQLNAEVQDFLGTITDSAEHLTRMLDALLELSRVGSVALQSVRVSLQTVVQEVLAERSAAYATRQVEWQVATDLPEVQADPALLRVALQQVLDNALKFTAGSSPTVIAVNALPEGSRLVLEVRDNGVGFNPAMQSKLLQPFQRLHSTREFSGLGMGLAIARKSLQRMGGDIRIEALPVAGCRVVLVLA